MEKYLCDQMCAELGKWLRIAGYDTAIISSALSDKEVLNIAEKEGRTLITRDSDFKNHKGVIYLTSESLDAWAEQLKEKGVDWLYRPFSRCLKCNTILESTSESSWICSTCHQTFWLGSHTEHMEMQLRKWSENFIKLGLGGDLMIGRLVDEHLERVSPSYIWGNLRPLLHSMDINIVNLETALTRSEKIVPKVFNFKAKPERVAALIDGSIHAVNLANNHTLDFSEEGLLETIETLDHAGIPHVGAGKNISQAQRPIILERKGVKIGLLGCTDNEPTWKASNSHPGTNYLKVGDLDVLSESIIALRSQVDVLIVSIHWGPNMVKRPTAHFRTFAHALIDLGVDILHGHSAHVVQGVEIYKKKLILYDTGELVDDYAVDPEMRNDRSFFLHCGAEPIAHHFYKNDPYPHFEISGECLPRRRATAHHAAAMPRIGKRAAPREPLSHP